MKELARDQDDSRELKRGEIKHMLIQAAYAMIPDFEFHGYKYRCYFFKRVRQVNHLSVYELLQIVFSLKENNFACSVASLLNPGCLFSSAYNAGLLNPQKDLKVLKYDSEVLKMENAYYFHDGKVLTIANTVKEVFMDFKNYGLLFLETQFKALQSNTIIRSGLEYIDRLKIDKEQLKKEITEELNRGGFVISNVKHPIYTDLKERIQAVSGQSKEDRQKIPKTALEFLELYWSR